MKIGLGISVAQLARGGGGAPAAWDFTSGVTQTTRAGASNTVYVIYGGWNLRGSAAGTVEAAIASAVAGVPGGANKYLVLGVPTFEDATDYAGAANHEKVLTINNNLDTTYGLHWASPTGAYVDLREKLVAAYSPVVAQDVIDFGRDITPSSLRSGNTTFSAGGISAINSWVAAIITEKGW
jgi:hypothetical protein